MMTEQIAFGESVSAQNEVDYEPLFPSIDSPSSIDSGVDGSPGSSNPGSPSFSDDIDTRNPEESSTAPAEKTVKKLLELLVAAKTAGERSLLSNILTTLVSTSLKKDNVPPAPLTPKASVVEHYPKVEIPKKRPADPSPCGTPVKIPRTSVTSPASVKPSIFMVEQPEQNYRARYESEGCRGPVHGSSELTFPTFQIKGYNSPLWVTVYLATSNGTPHFHLLCGPGSTKLPCRDTTLPDGVAAIQVLVGPETEMTAVLDCISLKRRRNFEADKELRRRGLNPADWKAERKEACFVMTAEIPDQPSQKITCKSKVFQCTAPPGHPEIWWMRPVQGYATGGEEIGIIGKKFLKGFQVKFFGELPSGEMWQAYGEIDRSKTNTGACVVKSPPLKDPITSPFTVNVEISGDHASNYTSSDSVTFTYLPVEKPSDQENLELIRILNEIAGLSPESTSVLDLGIDALSQEWEEILHSIDQLYQTGCITEHQNTELRLLVSQHDTILLEAFRTTKQTVADSEFLSVFCQYVAGMNVPQCTN